MKTTTTKRICQKFVRYSQSEDQSETTVVSISETTVSDERIAKEQIACILQSTFVAFDSKLRVSHQYTISSWDHNSQILVGAFLGRSRCLASHTCTSGDDILVLNRKTGQAKQFVFSFGNRFKVFDNRVQAFLREGVASSMSVSAVDATSFSLMTTLATSIHNEELY